MLPNRLNLLQLIPKPETFYIAWLLGGIIKHDTCDTVQSLGYKLEDMIFAIAKENNMPSNKLKLYQGDCHNHTWCVWFGHISNYLGHKLEEHLREDLKLIPNQLHDTCCLSKILIQVDKEYNLTANNPKGHGDDFNDWLCQYHPLLLMSTNSLFLWRQSTGLWFWVLPSSIWFLRWNASIYEWVSQV
jgi:hypothetical protein